jgi:formylmethanofuran dehydrogenase subunit B
MERAWIAGRPTALEDAIAEAAQRLAASRQTLISGLGTDIAGARAAIALAARTGAIIDHMHAQAVLDDLEVMRSSGIMLTTPTEARVRAETLLVVGPDLGGVLVEFLQKMIGSPRPSGGGSRERRMFWLCPGPDAAKAESEIPIRLIGSKARDLPALLAALRARIGGRPSGNGPISAKLLLEVSNALKAARFGVAVWSPAALDPLAIEMLCGLVNELNATTRFCTLPLAPQDNALGIMHVCSWMTGFPMRTGFGRGDPRHDPWLFESRRLVANDETDCVLWISAYRPEAPPWLDPRTTIALTGHDARFASPARVHIAVGCPGRDHDGAQYCSLTGTLAAVAAAQPSATISVADVITRIATALPDGETSRC